MFHFHFCSVHVIDKYRSFAHIQDAYGFLMCDLRKNVGSRIYNSRINVSLTTLTRSRCCKQNRNLKDMKMYGKMNSMLLSSALIRPSTGMSSCNTNFYRNPNTEQELNFSEYNFFCASFLTHLKQASHWHEKVFIYKHVVLYWEYMLM